MEISRHPFTMPTYAVDITGIVAFASEDKILASLGCLLGWLGVLVNGLVLVGNIGRQDNANRVYMLALSLVDFLICLFYSVFVSGALMNGGFSWGQEGCFTYTVSLLVFAQVSFLLMFTISLERLITTVFMYKAKSKEAYAVITGIFVTNPITHIIVFLRPDQYHYVLLEDHHWGCIADYTSTEFSMRSYAITSATLAVVCGTSILFSYATVYMKFRSVFQRSNRKNKNIMQKKVLIKCLAITIAFFLLWTPEFTAIIYEVSTFHHRPKLLGQLGSLGVVVSSAINPILMLVLDSHVRTNAFRWFKNKNGKQANSLQVEKNAGIREEPNVTFSSTGTDTQVISATIVLS